MNNTSVVLLLKVAGKTLLFPGDAQGESWDYWLPKHAADIAKIDFYKVGHHGSRNATAQKMVKAWPLPRLPKRAIAGMISTKQGVFGTPAEETEVPRAKLVEDLEARMAFLVSTEALHKDTPFVEVACDLTQKSATFQVVP